MKKKHIIYTLSTIPLAITIGNVSDSDAFFGLDNFMTRNRTISDVVDIKDKNLLKAINNQLGRGEVLDSVTITDIESLTILNAQERNISSIEGLEYAVNLRELNLGSNKLVNISSLCSLTKLTKLYLHDNQISDISSLSNLINLTELYIGYSGKNGNNVENISSLSNLINLKKLNIEKNKISDISSLSNLTNLTYLNIDSNKISDISILKNLTNLTDLNISNNKISDISVLENLNKLNVLFMQNNKMLDYQISDVSVLKNLTSLTHLNISYNKIIDISPLSNLTNLTRLNAESNLYSDLKPVENLTNLTWLEFHTTKVTNMDSIKNLTKLKALYTSSYISDISILENLTNLTILNMCNNKNISDISVLENLTKLNKLYLNNNNISDISVLGNLTNLNELEVNNNLISDISVLELLTNLKELNLGSNQITDISSLENLTELTLLKLPNNRISDISALKHLTNLTILNLGTILVLEDISPLSNLTALTQLYLDNNKIVDVSPLKKLYNLCDLYLHNNKISDISPLKNLTKLTNLKLENQSISISETSEIGYDLSTTYINNPIKGINNEKVDITSVSSNGYYQNGKLYWDNISLGNYSFVISFSKTYNINGNNVVYNGTVNINLEVIDGAGPNISNDSCINEDELSIYVTINAEDLLSDVDYLIHNGEQYQLPYTFKYDIYSRNNNIVEVFDDLGNSSIYEVTANELSLDMLNQYISLLESDNNSPSNISYIRAIVNSLNESLDKDLLSNRINNIPLNIELDKKTATSNLDVYIKCENTLQMSIDTNQITFDEFSGIEDVVKENAVNITINSSLPYQLNAYLPAEIQNSDKTKTLDKSILNIKENSESDYQVFVNTTDKLILKDNCSAGNYLTHGVDLKLAGGIAHEKDVYKTTIKFEAEQK